MLFPYLNEFFKSDQAFCKYSGLILKKSKKLYIFASFKLVFTNELNYYSKLLYSVKCWPILKAPEV